MKQIEPLINNKRRIFRSIKKKYLSSSLAWTPLQKNIANIIITLVLASAIITYSLSLLNGNSISVLIGLIITLSTIFITANRIKKIVFNNKTK
jgi:hypothetical protein